MTVGDYPLREKIVVVTGGGGGLSFEFVKLAVEQNNKVIIADLRLTPAAEEFVKMNSKPHAESGSKPHVESESGHVIFTQCDVAVWADLNHLVTVSMDRFGDVPDVYVAGAGLFEKGPYSFFTDEESDRYTLMDVNASHPIKLTRIGMKASLPRNKKTVVAIVASMAGLYPLYPSPVYNASKHAVVGFVKCMKPADVEENVKIVAVCPGLVDTPLWTDDIKAAWKFDESIKLSAKDIADTILQVIEDGQYPGGTVMTHTHYAGRRVEEFVDIEALVAPLKESSYGPVREILRKEREGHNYEEEEGHNHNENHDHGQKEKQEQKQDHEEK
ncbi:hypothetical protein A1O3_02491 [Capronia epimyces CBS 606.96]|uniref:Uncharacterized protein n=1 Tax=Capronia epimyces CBS 606.96 TaxID=1182542 RepID=W9Z4L1_9EURO|nr:uncharacterized protein A1O3_02491 [Capronia epimyces CBS 606.96]EXJ89424.1 hypothetical protein A1O3_02491 [Capronia epimyces CBS 606.96]